MPLRYVIDKERRLVISTARDRVTFAEIKAHQDELLQDSEFDPEFNQLIDTTAVTVLDVSVEEAKTVARRKMFSRTSRRAFLAVSPAVFGMGRLMEVYHHQQAQIYVFYDLPSALKWLGLEGPPDPIGRKEAKTPEISEKKKKRA